MKDFTKVVALLTAASTVFRTLSEEEKEVLRNLANALFSGPPLYDASNTRSDSDT